MLADLRSDDFIPSQSNPSDAELLEAFADLGAVLLGNAAGGNGIRIPLPHTRREDGTIDAIDIGGYRKPDVGRPVYFVRKFRAGDDLGGFANVTSPVGWIAGWLVVLVVRGLWELARKGGDYPLAGARPLRETAEGALLHVLGIGPR